MQHGYSFDPSYGMGLADLLEIEPPIEPTDFDSFWRKRYRKCRDLAANARVLPSKLEHSDWRIKVVNFRTTDNRSLSGWLLIPKGRPINRAIVWGHGYGGREAPDFKIPLEDAVIFFHFCRGIGLSAQKPFSKETNYHVLHSIDSVEDYVLGGCVEDTWMAVTAILELYPEVTGRIAYSGVSFSGGIGAIASAYDDRIARIFLDIPSFGNQAMRLKLPSVGSAGSVAAHYAQHNKAVIRETISYHDASTAAARIKVETLCACALFDPNVAPPGQFAIFNAIDSDLRHLFVRPAGHFEYDGMDTAEELQHRAVRRFLSEL